MKKTVISLVLLSFLAATPALARDGGKDDGPFAEIRDKVMEKIGNLRHNHGLEIEDEAEVEIEAESGLDSHRGREASTTARTASTSAHRVTVRREVAERLAAHAEKVLAATIERLERIGNRIESRIAKVKADGGDTTLSENALAAARERLAEAKAKLAGFSAVDLSAETMSEDVETLRGIAGEVKESLKAARASLSDAINSLKPGRSLNNGNRGNASSTASTTEEEH